MFPQNKYILVNIRKRKIDDEHELLKKCEVHGKELMFYCKELRCNKPICPICHLRDHIRHNVVELEELQKEEQEVFIAKLEVMKDSLERNKTTLMKTKEEIVNENEVCVKEL